MKMKEFGPQGCGTCIPGAPLMAHTHSVADPGGPRGPWLPGPVKISHKKDGC